MKIDPELVDNLDWLEYDLHASEIEIWCTFPLKWSETIGSSPLLVPYVNELYVIVSGNFMLMVLVERRMIECEINSK